MSAASGRECNNDEPVPAELSPSAPGRAKKAEREEREKKGVRRRGEKNASERTPCGFSIENSE